MTDADYKIKTALNEASKYGKDPDITEANLSEKLDDATEAIGNQVTKKADLCISLNLLIQRV